MYIFIHTKLIKMYYSLAPGKVEFDKMKKAFITNLLKSPAYSGYSVNENNFAFKSLRVYTSNK